MHLFTVDLKDQPDELTQLGQHRVNLGLGGVTAGDDGLVYLIASDEDAARTALETANLPYAQHPALQVKCADHLGEARRVLGEQVVG
jgi:hypothetical protein